ncbi:MAG: CotH kinase family protein [Bacilli bacterium]|nr:CotH kinase family protein [Bacilli bacterium]
MKNVLKKMTYLMVGLLVTGCGAKIPTENSTSNNPSTSANPGKSSTSNNPGPSRSSSSAAGAHVHAWSTDWAYDETLHWHTCSGCNEKNANVAHTFGEWQEQNLGTLLSKEDYNRYTVKYKECSVCHYRQMDATYSVLPEIRFTFEASDPNADFATKARSTDSDRPTVEGKISVTNAGDLNITDAVATMKVRGNQTAGFDKKGLQIKFDKKQNLLDLNAGPDGKGFKKWVLLADAKDTTISRSALGLTMSKGVIAEDSKAWSVNFTPVSVYLNNQYWGMYMLADQKEVKDGRIKLAEPIEEVKNPETGKKEEVPIMTTDIGYCFELDNYAKDESKKADGGDPTFRIDYDGMTSRDFNVEGNNSVNDLVYTYTMNSDINDGPEGTHVDDSNSEQVKFIKNRLTALFKVLHQAASNNRAYEINANNQAVATSAKTVKQVVEENFDLNAWAEGFIINAVCLPPDVGYSSFYMSFDNTENGDKKLRFDNPWDFDSNFGNRRNFLVNPDQKNGNYDPYYMDRTANLWFQLLNKLDFFINDYVKPKWNAVREAKVFEKMLGMADVYYTYFDGEYQKNFAKWTTTQASDQNVASYFNGDGVNRGELRTPFVEVSQRKQAQKETIRWLTSRINYLEKQWGNNRPGVTAE